MSIKSNKKSNKQFRVDPLGRILKTLKTLKTKIPNDWLKTAFPIELKMLSAIFRTDLLIHRHGKLSGCSWIRGLRSLVTTFWSVSAFLRDYGSVSALKSKNATNVSLKTKPLIKPEIIIDAFSKISSQNFSLCLKQFSLRKNCWSKIWLMSIIVCAGQRL